MNRFLMVLAVFPLLTPLAKGQVDLVSQRHATDSLFFGDSDYDGWDFGASTAFGSATRGLADLVRAQGAENLLSSEAAINMTEARRRQIENFEKATETYFAMRRQNQAYRAAERGSRPTYEDLVRYAEAGKPERLSPSEMDTVTGDITWPIILRSDHFEEYREVLGQLFASRAATGALSSEGYLTVDKVTDAMKAELQRKIDDIPPQDYLRARKFIESLAFEVKAPAG
ncbi:MAG: hypothetical protein GXY83_25805 [Rhodopirellula sp.]|nr:hypothetical protein [Rhodopirellula sp.]